MIRNPYLRKLHRYFNRTKSTIKFINNHPITKNNKVSAYRRYTWFHIDQLLNSNKVVIHNWIDGVQFYASMGEGGVVGNIYTGLEDFEEMSFLLHFLRPDDLFVDVGANVGIYTLLASGVCKSKAIAIEPIPATFERLEKNIGLNELRDNVKIFKMGLGSKKSILSFVDLPISGWSHVATGKESLDTSLVTVGVMPLDDLVDEGINPNLMKIDVEGFELEVLKGALKTLGNKNLNAIIIELNGSGDKYGVSDEMVVRDLLSYGFSQYQYDPFNREIIPFSNHKSQSNNTLFIRDTNDVVERIKVAPKRRILNTLI